MTPKPFFTTREAARVLGISLSTVSRKFDQGLLSGQKNPISGKRLVSRESVAAILDQYQCPNTDSVFMETRVLLATPDKGILALFQKVFSEKEKIRVEWVESGGDVLIRCGKGLPDLLVLDEDIPVVPYQEIVRSLRRENQRDLKIVCLTTGRDEGDGVECSEILEKERVEEGALRKRIFSLLGLSEDRRDENRAFKHQRRWPRKKIDLPANLWVYRLAKPYHREKGVARIGDISLGGAFLHGIEMEKGRLPGEAFRIVVEVNQPPLIRWRAHCRVVRLQSDGIVTAGVEFERISEAKRKMIKTALFQ